MKTPTESGRHIDVFLNSAHLPARGDLCRDTGAFQPGPPSGNTADYTSALCDGRSEVTTATGRIVTADGTPGSLNKDVDTIRHELYHALYPAADDPTDFPLN